MKKRSSIVLSGILLFGITSLANANLLINGSFEEPIVTDHGGQWQLFSSVTGWGNADYTEIQTDTLFGPAADGKQYVELDSNAGDGNNWLVQTFDTILGQEYTFTFAFSPRQGVSENLLWAGIVSYYNTPKWLVFDGISASGIGVSGTNWNYYSYTFIADWTQATVAFKDGGADDSYGTFVDNVSVTPVPEPSTFLIFGAGLAGLAAAGRRRRD